MSFDFIVVEIEAAKNNLTSPSSLALVMVKDLKIVNKKHFVIEPPVLDSQNTASFSDIWRDIEHYFIDNMIVAHNAIYQMAVLKSCLLQYNIPTPDFTYLCSIPVSARALKGKDVGRSLKDRASYFGINLEDENSSLSRAVTCAELIIACVRVKKRKSFASYCYNAISLPFKSFRKLNPQTV